jgi:hypothetical protein
MSGWQPDVRCGLMTGILMPSYRDLNNSICSPYPSANQSEAESYTPFVNQTFWLNRDPRLIVYNSTYALNLARMPIPFSATVGRI